MTPYEQFLIAAFLFVVIGLVVAHFIDRRRQRSVEDFEQKRRERKAEVERAARKAL